MGAYAEGELDLWSIFQKSNVVKDKKLSSIEEISHFLKAPEEAYFIYHLLSEVLSKKPLHMHHFIRML